MKIALLGDIALFGKNSPSENPKVFTRFKELAEILSGFDYVVGNLETPFVRPEELPSGAKSAHLRGTPEAACILKFLNISCVNLANNHIFDYGESGFLTTVEVLKQTGIDFFGVDHRSFQLERQGNKIVFSGYCCYSSNALGYLEPGIRHGVNVLSGESVEADLRKAEEAGFLPVASVHCGQEHVNYPSPDHMKLARKLAGKADYIFYGHHPHVLQGVETVNRSLLAYSLGNLCFDDIYTSKSLLPLVQMSNNNRSSAVLGLEVSDSKMVSHHLIPLFDDGENIVADKSGRILDVIQQYSHKLSSTEDEYQQMRYGLLNEYLSSRKKKRDIMWYLKRLNLNSWRMLQNGKHNFKRYRQCVQQYIED